MSTNLQASQFLDKSKEDSLLLVIFTYEVLMLCISAKTLTGV